MIRPTSAEESSKGSQNVGGGGGLLERAVSGAVSDVGREKVSELSDTEVATVYRKTSEKCLVSDVIDSFESLPKAMSLVETLSQPNSVAIDDYAIRVFDRESHMATEIDSLDEPNRSEVVIEGQTVYSGLRKNLSDERRDGERLSETFVRFAEGNSWLELDEDEFVQVIKTPVSSRGESSTNLSGRILVSVFENYIDALDAVDYRERTESMEGYVYHLSVDSIATDDLNAV